MKSCKRSMMIASLGALVMVPALADIASTNYVQTRVANKSDRASLGDAGQLATVTATGDFAGAGVTAVQVTSAVSDAAIAIANAATAQTTADAKQDKVAAGTSGVVLTQSGTEGVFGTRTVDTTPTTNSPNLVTSGGVALFLNEKVNIGDMTAKQDVINGAAGTVVTNTGVAGTVGALAIDTTPTTNSANLITSGGVAAAISAGQTVGGGTSGTVVTNTGVSGTVGELTIDAGPVADSPNLVTSGGVMAAVDRKQEPVPAGTAGTVLTQSGFQGSFGTRDVDTTPTTDSTNLITSGGVAAAISAGQTVGGGTSGTVVTNTGVAGTVGALAIDAGPITGSNNLITSGGVFAYAIPQPPVACADVTNKCVLVTDGTAFTWEVVAR